MKRERRPIEHWQVIAACLMVYDYLALNASWFLALWIRFDFSFQAIMERFLLRFRQFTPWYALGCVILFLCCHMYRSMLRFASIRDLTHVLVLSLITSALHVVLSRLLVGHMPVSYLMMGPVLQAMLLLLPRFSFRMVLYLKHQRNKGEITDRVMLIGAGEAGQMILRDIRSAEEIHEKVVCIIDDNPNKWNRYIEGVPIVGGREEILKNVEKYRVTKIYLAIPSAKAEDKKEILGICKETDCELKSLPGMYQIVLGQVSISDMKEVSIEDLLGREPIQPEMKEVFDFLNGKTVLVTGGGGSIGSELCRQIAAHQPERLIIFDIYENNAYAIQLELKERYPDLKLEVLIGSVRDSLRLFQIFDRYRPQVVYHAAAHKHVPLMEDSPNESIKNNPFGTYNTAYAAVLYGCERFVLISSDKAVNPTNIMGASKRLCEMIVQAFDAKVKEGKAADIPKLFTELPAAAGVSLETTSSEVSAGVENLEYHDSIHGHNLSAPDLSTARTEFVAVRFGNVLGSNGSVVPIFKRQIAQGGPVTVTHPDIIRYFMTISEAVSLVLLAGTFAHGGQIFVLDMGSPVKIDTLARNLIRLSGFVPDEDIKIVYTGLRPGEKLYEEKLMEEEGLQKTENSLIHIGRPISFDTDEFLGSLAELKYKAEHNSDDIRSNVERLVSTYHPA